MFDSLLNKTATIYRKSESSTNSFGESTFTLDSVETIKCAIQPLREQLVFHLGGTDYVATEKIFCNINVNIQPGDYLVVDGIKYLVLSVQDAAGRGHHLEVLVRRN